MTAVKPVTGFFTFVAFFLWIQPLGAFIAPSMEEAACGGHRAFHMCSVQFGSAPAGREIGRTSTSQKVFFTAAASVEKTGPESSGAGVHVESLLRDAAAASFAARLIEAEKLFPPTFRFSPPIPVPKF